MFLFRCWDMLVPWSVFFQAADDFFQIRRSLDLVKHFPQNPCDPFALSWVLGSGKLR